MSKQALVCTECEEVEWIEVSPIHLTDRRWWLCHYCYEKGQAKDWV